jgi:hypothetical protein
MLKAARTETVKMTSKEWMKEKKWRLKEWMVRLAYSPPSK